MNRTLILAFSIFFASCYIGPPKCPEPFKKVNFKDINPILRDSIGTLLNDFYKINDTLSNDAFVVIFRSTLFQNINTIYPTKVIVALGSIHKKLFISCENILGRLSPIELKRAMEYSEGNFICFDSSLSAQNYFYKNNKLFDNELSEPWEIDAHWAWFSATGDSIPINKMIRAYLNDDKCCANCIEWSLSSRIKDNQDANEIFMKVYDSVPDVQKIKLDKIKNVNRRADR